MVWPLLATFNYELLLFRDLGAPGPSPSYHTVGTAIDLHRKGKNRYACQEGKQGTHST